MTALRRLAAVGLVLAGCGGAAVGPGGKPEFPPKAAFRAYAAAQLHVAPGELNGGSNSEAQARLDREHTRGNALPYVMWSGSYNNALRGWVTLDGTVITPTQNLGRLLAEEGVWDRPPRRQPDELAGAIIADLLWSYGPDVEEAIGGFGGVKPPSLELAPDGSGTLRFVLNDHRVASSDGGGGGGGGGGAPADVLWEYTIAITADHRATLSRKPFEPQIPPEAPRSANGP
jgi:hypothetical protein